MRFRTRPTVLAAWLLSAVALGSTACDDDNPPPPPVPATTGKLTFEFKNVVGSQPLVLGQSYTTLAGDPFTVTKFNYFISNIKLTKADGAVWAEPESYHLVKQADAASQTFELSDVPNGDYTRLTYTIGVDSARNMSGAQTGALDPLNDMFWSWSSGYIFLKIEGTSPQAASGSFLYHVGGFRIPYSTIRTVSPALPTSSPLVQVTSDKTPKLSLQADVQKIFAGPTTIRLAQLSNTGHSADPNSVKIADNYAAGMFRISQLSVQ